MRMPPVIYQIIVAGDGRSYVGSATYFPTRRAHHRWHLKTGQHHCIALRHAAIKHGMNAVEFKILEKVDDPANLIEREQYWLDRLRGNLYNKSLTASPGASHRLTVAQKEAVSKFHTGRKRSPETRAKMSASMKGNTNGRHSRRESCKRGHPLEAGNLYFRTRNNRTERTCKACALARAKEWRA